MLQSLTIGSYDCNATGRFVSDWSFPDARITDFGRSAQLSGAGRFESHYEDAPWQFTQVFSAATRADIDGFLDALVPGALVTLGEDTGTASSRIVTIDTTDASTTGFTRYIVSGTRRPAWRGASQAFSATLAINQSIAALPTVGGSIGAEMDLTVTHASAGSFSALGIKHAPLAGYDPADSAGGSWSTPVALSTTPATIHAGSDIDVTANRGNHILCAYLLHTATVASTLNWKAASSILTASRESRPVASRVANTAEFVNLGIVSIPAATLPARSDSGVVYASETAGASNTTGSTYLTAVWPSVGKFGQSFAHAGGLQTGVAIWIKNNSAQPMIVTCILRGSSGTNPNQVPDFTSNHASATVTIPSGHDGLVRFTWSVLLPAGQYTAMVQDYDGTGINNGVGSFMVRTAGTYASGNAFSLTGYNDTYATALATTDLYFTAYRRAEVSFNAKTAITATCTQSGKTASWWSCVRVPADIGAVVTTTAYAAGKGWAHDAASKSYYPADSGGVTGTALATYRVGALEPLPGENTLVIFNDGGETTITGTITDQRITRG